MRKLLWGLNKTIFAWFMLLLSSFYLVVNFVTVFSLPTTFFDHTNNTGIVQIQILPNNIQQVTTPSTCSGCMEVNHTSYITVYPYKGGLGNQLFQLASLIGISQTSSHTSFLCSDNNNKFLPTDMFELSEFNNKPCATGLDSYFRYQESAHAKYEKVHLDSTKNWTLEGYFQSFKYFKAYTDTIKQTLKIKKIFLDKARGFLERNVPKNSVKVGIHVRRGDFITKTQKQLGRVAPDRDYITKAKTIFQKLYSNITFIVITDDKQWCRANLIEHGVLLSPFHHEGPDLALAQLCDHMIITVGTFGWWAGWLAAGQVVYYSKYPRPGSQIHMEFSKEDYYPSTWTPLP